MNDGPFAGRTLCIATMHGKERVIAQRLETALGVHCVLPPAGFDTDRFGTFSGEVPRVGTPRDAARAKAIAAMDAAATDLAVASEGSFVPHPDAFLLQIGIEIVLLVDRRADIEIAGEHVTTETNHARQRCRGLDEASAFAARIGFPTHGLLVVLGEPPQRVWRGLHTEAALRAAVADATREGARDALPWFVTSDMRADHNPTRMRAIDRAAAALAERATTLCPSCATPGFGAIDVVRGLPCSDCGTPTARPRAFVHGCVRCAMRLEVPRTDDVVAAEPAGCDVCNP